MNYYLIDYENVGSHGVERLHGLSEGDAIILFYSENCKNITLDVVTYVMKWKPQFSSFKVKVGTKNALDFQLAAHLGYLIGKGNNPGSKYYIVSNDKGYDCLRSYWRQQGAIVERISFADDFSYTEHYF